MLGRYQLGAEFASGGMASIFLGRRMGSEDGRLVAIKRLHPHLARDPGFVSMLLDEARIGSRLAHPNLVSIIDVIREADQIALVMDYVHGESLHALAVRHAAPLAPDLACGVAVQVLRGLEAVHALCGSDGTHLQVVHRDVSPHNILVDTEGVARVTDFGIAKSMANQAIFWC